LVATVSSTLSAQYTVTQPTDEQACYGQQIIYHTNFSLHLCIMGRWVGNEM